MSNFEPKIRTKETAEDVAEATPAGTGAGIPEFTATTAEDVLNDRIRDLEAGLAVLRGERKDVKLRARPEKLPPVDWSKMSETEVFNLNIPITVVDHGLPDYLTIQLKDSNYVPRWVNKHPIRLGGMKAVGWSFITEEDLAEGLSLDIQPNADGQYQYHDVVAMKATKEYYFGVLRKNHLRAINMVDPKAVHAASKRDVEDALTDSTLTGATRGTAEKYMQSGKLAVYAPGFEI